MPLVHPAHVVSFRSEDPYHPASNLLNRETYRKWKCKEAGEKEAFVILKFDKAVAINAIDIGNDGSALVEVSVARSGTGGEPQFEVLLSSTAFMSPGDSRESKNMNGVRNFTLNSLSKPIAAQKWDLVKVLVSQPFNKHVQYGLTFIKFVSAPDPNEPKKIGAFGFRAPIGGEDSDDDDIRPGRLFSSFSKSPKKDSGSPGLITNSSKSSIACTSTHSEIMSMTNRIFGAAKSSTDHEVKNLLKTSKPNLLPTPSPSSNGTNAQSGRNSSPLLNRKQLPDAPIRPKKKDDNSDSPKPRVLSAAAASTSSSPSVSKKRPLSPEPSTNQSPAPSSSNGSAKKQKKVKKTKQFNKLFEGVVFVLSGFQNPLRGQLRDKAVAMGARYKADWNRTCTHLICAFYNTPKFREVRSAGNGNIVKKDWIEASHEDKCRYPWRRYCLDRSDKGSESEDEIFAEADDNEEEVLEEEPMQTSTNSPSKGDKVQRKRIIVLDSSDSDEDNKSNNDNDSKKAYDADTDVDDDDKTPDLSPSLMSTESSKLFENKGFYLDPSLYNSKTSEVAKIILEHKGQIHASPTDATEYYVCPSLEWKEEHSDALSDNPNLVMIYENWIINCHKENCLIDKDDFILTP